MANQINAIQRQTAALCCVARNENRYLKEWVDYHLGIGFSRIYIYDVGDAGDERCDSLELGENVHVVNSFRGRRKRGNVVVDAYKKCYAEIGGSVKWIMYLGVNEFFALEKHSCVSDFLIDFIKSKGAVQCIHFNCRSYGSGGAEKYEDRPVRERFTAPSGNESYDKRYRSIYRTKIRSMDFVGHYCARNLHFTYNCGNWILPTTRTVTYAGGHVDWYVTKSREEYAESGNRSPLYGNGLGMNFYNEFNHCEGKTVETPVGLGSAVVASVAVPNTGAENGVSICLSAWNTQDYIEECLDSIANQTWFKTHDNWEILLGIDACEKTLAKVNEIMHKYKNLSVYMMNENVGTYVTCNTIMKQAKYEWLLRFDTDDVMLPNMIEIMMKERGDVEFVQCQKQDFGMKSDISLAYGVVLMKRNVFNKFNGYRNWRCDGDNDFAHRINKTVKRKRLNNVLFKRRVHLASLTNDEKTNFTSDVRKEHLAFINTPSNYDTLEKCILATCATTKFRYFSNKTNEKIIVTFTSWKKRIQHCSHIVDLMKRQTIKPNKIILNLSTDEFKNKERDLPIDLIEKQDGFFEIYWVKENTKPYKKIIPTLNRFPNDIIISIDDDIEYPQDFIEHLYNEYVFYDRKLPITSGEYKWENNIYTHYGCFSLIKKAFVGNYLDDLYKNVVLKNGIDKIPFCDPVITYAVLLNGLRYRMTPYFNMSVVRRKSPIDKQNRLSEIGTDNYKKTMKNEHDIIKKYILEKYHKTYDNLFDAPIVVNITTWTKRDWCLYQMLKSLKEQTLQPDEIILWLSEDEYNKNNLPQTIQKCINEHLLTDIKWVKKNTYCHKRFECFNVFNDCYNLLLDDDILYEKSFIQKLYDLSKTHQDCIALYTSRSTDYINYKVIESDITKEPSHKNKFMGGRCCIPPHIIPTDVLNEHIDMRDIYVKKCDESWLRPFLIRHDIKVVSLYTFWKDYKFKSVDGSQDCAVWNENKSTLPNGMREKERNFYNAIKITHTEKLCKKIWPKMDIDNWTLIENDKIIQK